jgi:hypothetical protein
MAYLILIAIGAFLGVMLAAGLGLGRPSGSTLADLRDAFREGVLQGHLLTVRSEFSCANLGSLADEWLDNKLADARAAAADDLPANFV